MITVLCVLRSGGIYTSDWVNRLRHGVTRHLAVAHRFACLSDTAVDCDRIPLTVDWPGWWAKISLFKPGLLTGRCVYFDLDTLITGPLDELVKHRGLLHLDRWGWKTKTYGTGVMVFDAGEHAEIWEQFTPEVMKQFRGDQDYITSLGGWDALPDGINVSYRYHCKDGPPPGASTVSFHGVPKPSDLPVGHWARRQWEQRPSA